MAQFPLYLGNVGRLLTPLGSFPLDSALSASKAAPPIEYLYINNPEKSNDIPNNAKEAAMSFLLERTDTQNVIFVGKDVLKKGSNQYDRASI
jgi:hypothetical protein